jgi:hypothetical protein
MNEEQRKQIHELNRKHFTEFGVTGDGRLCYQWMRTDEMPIEFGRGYKENMDRESGLWLAHRQYKRRMFAETHANGACWTIAVLMTPTRDLWISQFGTDFPWPANGMYVPVDNIVMRVDILPGEEESMRAAYNIRETLKIVSKGYEQAFKHFSEEDAAEGKKVRDSFQNKVNDFVDDSTPAFGNNPGGKGHVSLPSIGAL